MILKMVDVVEARWNFSALEKAAAFAAKNPRPEDPEAPRPQIHRVSHRLTKQDRARIVETYLGGASSREVGRRFSVGKNTVITLVRQAGHQPR